MRFSTTVDAPNFSCSFCASRRPSASLAAPGGHGTITLTVRPGIGHAPCACTAGACTAPSAAAPAATFRNVRRSMRLSRGLFSRVARPAAHCQRAPPITQHHAVMNDGRAGRSGQRPGIGAGTAPSIAPYDPGVGRMPGGLYKLGRELRDKEANRDGGKSSQLVTSDLATVDHFKPAPVIRRGHSIGCTASAASRHSATTSIGRGVTRASRGWVTPRAAGQSPRS